MGYAMNRTGGMGKGAKILGIALKETRMAVMHINKQVFPLKIFRGLLTRSANFQQERGTS
jgi:hypothetical protein